MTKINLRPDTKLSEAKGQHQKKQQMMLPFQGANYGIVFDVWRCHTLGYIRLSAFPPAIFQPDTQVCPQCH